MVTVAESGRWRGRRRWRCCRGRCGSRRCYWRRRRRSRRLQNGQPLFVRGQPVRNRSQQLDNSLNLVRQPLEGQVVLGIERNGNASETDHEQDDEQQLFHFFSPVICAVEAMSGGSCTAKSVSWVGHTGNCGGRFHAIGKSVGIELENADYPRDGSDISLRALAERAGRWPSLSITCWRWRMRAGGAVALIMSECI